MRAECREAAAAMVGKAYDCLANPLGAVRYLFDNAAAQGAVDQRGGDWGVHPLFSKALLDDGALAQVPEINSVPLDAIPANSLVRFRGMVQDMLNVEYYIGAYKDGELWRTNKYSDAAALPPSAEATMQIWERRPLYCVPVPGENDWVKNAFTCQDMQFPIPHSIAEVRMNQKRAREASSPMYAEDMETDSIEPAASPSEHKRPCSAVSLGVTTKENSSSQDLFHPNRPLEEKRLVSCLVKVYDGLDADVKLNDIVEFIGILTFDPQLTLHSHPVGESWDVQAALLEEDNSAHLPASLVPRLHSILHRKLSFDGLFQAMPQDAPECIHAQACPRSEFAGLRNSLVARLTDVLGGDGLAAEYLLLHLLSRVHVRVEPMALGKLSLNFIIEENAQAGTACTPLNLLSQAIEALLPRSHLMPLTLEFLNGKPIAPYKNYSRNCLMTGDLQLAEGTHLILDETALKTGQLTDLGLKNIHFIKNLMEWQKVEYDFEFYKMEMPTDVPVLVFSTARSRLFPADVVLPLRPTQDCSLELQPEALAKWRMYLGTARAGDHSIDPTMQKVLEGELVTARQADRSLGSDVFHRWLTLARLISVSYGESTLKLERWHTVRELERRLEERLRAC